MVFIGNCWEIYFSSSLLLRFCEVFPEILYFCANNKVIKQMENEEIDLVEVIAKLWHRKKVLLYFILFSLLGGVALAFLLPRKYTAECILALESKSRTTRISVEGMSAFQSMNMNDLQDVSYISPAMYPDIIFSVPFQKKLIYAPLYVNERGDTVSFYTYLFGKAAAGCLDAENGVEITTLEERECMAYLKKAVEVTVNTKDGNIKISVDMPEAKLAAQVAQHVQVLLQDYITRFRIAKAQAALDFIEERYHEVEAELENKQQALVAFQEKNNSMSDFRSESQEKILLNDYELFFSLYSDVVRQREKAKMQVKEDMPVLSVNEPVAEPASPSKPQRLLILVASLFLGLFAGCAWVLVTPLFREIAETKTIRLTAMSKVS